MATKKQVEKLYGIIEKRSLDIDVVPDDESTGGLFLILSSWSDLATLNHEWNKRKKAWSEWKICYEAGAWINGEEICGSMRLGNILVEGGMFYSDWSYWHNDRTPLQLHRWTQEKLLREMDKDTLQRMFDSYVIRAWVQCQANGEEHLRLQGVGHSPYTVPEGLEDVSDIFEVGFDDEYSTCDECRKLIRTSPDSYWWQPDYHSFEKWGGYICHECIRSKYPEEYIDEKKNSLSLLNTWIVDPEKYGWVKLDRDFESGLHRGQDDDPKKVLKAMSEKGYDILFTGDVSQFDVSWEVWVHLGEDCTWEDIKVANEDLRTVKSYQGFSTAREVSKALRGEHSDHIKVEKKIISQEDFINGI